MFNGRQDTVEGRKHIGNGRQELGERRETETEDGEFYDIISQKCRAYN